MLNIVALYADTKSAASRMQLRSIKAYAKPRCWKLDPEAASIVDALSKAIKESLSGEEVRVICSSGTVMDMKATCSLAKASESDWFNALSSLAKVYKFELVIIDMPEFVSGSFTSRILDKHYEVLQSITNKLVLPKTNPGITAASKRSAHDDYTTGRPPYGYRRVDKVLYIDQFASQNVTKVLAMRRKGMSRSVVGKEMKSRAKLDNTGEHWDHVKIRRIEEKIRLYTRGQLVDREGKIHTHTDLAFIPVEWEQDIAEAKP